MSLHTKLSHKLGAGLALAVFLLGQVNFAEAHPCRGRHRCYPSDYIISESTVVDEPNRNLCIAKASDIIRVAINDLEDLVLAQCRSRRWGSRCYTASDIIIRSRPGTAGDCEITAELVY